MAELPDRLRAAADAHRPDRERMLARVERAMAAPSAGPAPRPHPAAPWMRMTAVTAAVAGAIGLGGLAVAAVGAVGGDGSPARTVTAPAATTAPQPPPAVSGTSGTGTAHPSANPGRTAAPPGHRSAGPGHSPGGTAAPPAGGAAPTADPSTAPDTVSPRSPVPGSSGNGVSSSGALDAHSNPYWTQEDVTVTVSRPLTSLTVELRVAVTSGVSSTGSFSTVGQTTQTTTTDGGYLVYRWVLAPGQTLPPGTYTFAGQFHHDEGDRDTGGDLYSVEGDGPAGPATAEGGF